MDLTSYKPTTPSSITDCAGQQCLANGGTGLDRGVRPGPLLQQKGLADGGAEPAASATAARASSPELACIALGGLQPDDASVRVAFGTLVMVPLAAPLMQNLPPG